MSTSCINFSYITMVTIRTSTDIIIRMSIGIMCLYQRIIINISQSIYTHPKL